MYSLVIEAIRQNFTLIGREYIDIDPGYLAILVNKYIIKHKLCPMISNYRFNVQYDKKEKFKIFFYFLKILAGNYFQLLKF